MAGNSLGYRGRAACKCEPESGLTTIKLMKEDFRVSENLGEPDVLLCGLCAEAYDERREELGCTQCGAALKQDLTIDPRFGGRFGSRGTLPIVRGVDEYHRGEAARRPRGRALAR